VVLPDIGGLDLAEQFAKLRPAVPVLCMSGYSDRLWQRNQLTPHFLQKPFGAATILKEIRRLLDIATPGPTTPDRN
jgi:FixJ family two-component response regulator